MIHAMANLRIFHLIVIVIVALLKSRAVEFIVCSTSICVVAQSFFIHMLPSLFVVIIIPCVYPHIKTTRNNTCLATLPSIKTEYAQKGFHYMGAKLYNDLPINVGTAENKKDFMEKMDLFLKVK